MRFKITLPTLLLIGFIWPGSVIIAQEDDYLYELGAGVGASVAYGDINKSRPLYNPTLAADIVFRYNYSLRWSFVADLASYGLRGDSRDFGNVYPDGAQPSIDSRYWQLALRPEFNFRNYGWGNDFREKSRLVPFLTMGLGVGVADSGDKNAFAVSLPLGAGMKWKAAPRVNVQLTCLFTKTFSDNTDGLKDPFGIESKALKNTDWVGALMLGVTFEWGTRCIKCNNHDLDL